MKSFFDIRKPFMAKSCPKCNRVLFTMDFEWKYTEEEAMDCICEKVAQLSGPDYPPPYFVVSKNIHVPSYLFVYVLDKEKLEKDEELLRELGVLDYWILRNYSKSEIEQIIFEKDLIQKIYVKMVSPDLSFPVIELPTIDDYKLFEIFHITLHDEDSICEMEMVEHPEAYSEDEDFSFLFFAMEQTFELYEL